jgi:hypothetical protein
VWVVWRPSCKEHMLSREIIHVYCERNAKHVNWNVWKNGGYHKVTVTARIKGYCLILIFVLKNAKETFRFGFLLYTNWNLLCLLSAVPHQESRLALAGDVACCRRHDLTLRAFRTTWLACSSSFRSGTPPQATACFCIETCDIVCRSYVGVSCFAPI